MLVDPFLGCCASGDQLATDVRGACLALWDGDSSTGRLRIVGAYDPDATLSKLQDLDIVKAISQYATQQTTLEAAQKSFKTMSSLSLFNYIG